MAYTELALYVDSVAYSAVAAWSATHAYAVGNIVRQLAAPAVGSERCFVCILAGTSLSSEPSWTVTKGAITTEASGPKWQECTGLPAVNGDSSNTNAWHVSAGAIALGAVIKNTAADHYFICTTAGTGGTGSEPAWSTTAGATTADSTVTWTCLGAIASFAAKWAAPIKLLQNPVLNNTTSWLVNVNMTVFVGDDHAETVSGANLGNIFALSILCVDHTAAVPPGSGNLKTTAQLTFTSALSNLFNTAQDVYAYGLQFIVNMSNSPGITVGNASAMRFRFEQCLFSKIDSNTSQVVAFFAGTLATGTMPVMEFKQCTFNLTDPTTVFGIGGGQHRFEACSFTGSLGGSGNQVFYGGYTNGTLSPTVVVEGCDFSNVASGGNLVGQFGSTLSNGSWTFKDCLVPAGVGFYRVGANSYEGLTVDANRCDSSGNATRNERHTYYADQTTATTVVRTSGAVDGTTPVAHKVTTTANAAFARARFQAVPLAIWNSIIGTNRNVTLYGIANDSRVPTNDEVWFDCEYLGSGTSPLGSFVRGSKSNVLAAGSALTVDTSAWDTQATTRANSHAYSVGDVLKTASNPGRIFFCTTAGTSASSEPGGYGSAVDGGSVTDGGATFRAGCRFSQTLTLSSPQPQQASYLYAYPKFGRASTTYYIDPMLALS